MTNAIKKYVTASIFFFVVGCSLSINHNPGREILATSSCGTVTDEYSQDFDNYRLHIEFEEDESWKNNYKHIISVSSDSGWSVTKVWLDVEDDNKSGFHLYSSGPLNNFNPNPGKKINKAKVEIFKACVSTPTPTIVPTCTPTNTPAPTLTPTTVPTNTPAPTLTPTTVPTLQPTPTEIVNTPTLQPTPTRSCEELENCEVTAPTPTIVPETSVTMTPTQTINNQTSVTSSNAANTDHGAPTCNDTDPGVPLNLHATALGGGRVRLDWSHSIGNHTGYSVAYGPSIGNYIYGDPNVGNVTTYTVQSLNPGGHYCFYVQAQNGCRGGSPSNIVCTNQPGTIRVLGSISNYNPLVEGIRESYGGDILGTSTELMATAEVVYSNDTLPSGNVLSEGQSISIPSVGINQSVYLPAKIGDEYTVGHQEVLHTSVDGSSVYYGHNGLDVFGALYKVNLNEAIYTTENGVNHSYKVAEKLFVHKSQVDSIKTSGDQIVLVTCSYTQPDYRIVIKASATK